MNNPKTSPSNLRDFAEGTAFGTALGVATEKLDALGRDASGNVVDSSNVKAARVLGLAGAVIPEVRELARASSSVEGNVDAAGSLANIVATTFVGAKVGAGVGAVAGGPLGSAAGIVVGAIAGAIAGGIAGPLTEAVVETVLAPYVEAEKERISDTTIAVGEILNTIEANKTHTGLSDDAFIRVGDSIDRIIDIGLLTDTISGRNAKSKLGVGGTHIIDKGIISVLDQIEEETGFRPTAPTVYGEGYIYDRDFGYVSLQDGGRGDNVVGDSVAYDYTKDERGNSRDLSWDPNGDGQFTLGERPPPRPETNNHGSNRSGGDGPEPGGLTSSPRPKARPENLGQEQESSGRDGGKPLLLDLDGDGVAITELSKSTVFMDAGGDGLLHRTAWAGAGDAVLFVDDDGDGTISEKREYVFTEWDPTATDDLAALRAVFDSNDDEVLDATDARFADFKLLVSNDDGSTTAKTLTELGITSISLTADTTRIELPDGSMITGQTTFTRTDGSTGTVANATLVAEAQGYRVDQVETLLAGGDRQVVSTAYRSDGDVAYVITSVTSPDGSATVNSYDDNGDGVVDRLQEITVSTDGSGNKTETVVNKAGAAAATAIVVSRIVTTTNADGSDVTVLRDSTGGGWFDQQEVRSSLPDGSRSIVISDLAENGSVIRGSGETTSVDGLTRVKGTDEDGDGLDDLSVTHGITEHGDGSRTESTVARNQDLSLRSSETMVVGPDGQSRVISRDADGDGVAETTEDLSITLNAGGTSTSVLDVENADGSLRSRVTQTQSADALSKTIATDADGDGDVESTVTDVTVIHGDGSRVNTITVTNTDGSVRSMEQTTLGADKVSTVTLVDLDQDGVFDSDEQVLSVTVDAATQERTTLAQSRAADGTVLASSTTLSSEDGLTRSTVTDADGDGDTDTAVSDVTVTDGAGVSTRTVETRNQDGSLRDRSVVVTSADGLTTTTQMDTDGDGQTDAVSVDARVLETDGSTMRTQSVFAGDGTTLLRRTVMTESADRQIMTTTQDQDGDGVTDVAVTSVESADGSVLATDVRTNADGSTIGSSETAVSANGLVRTTTSDLDGDGAADIEETNTTVLNADGSRTTGTLTRNGDGSLRASAEVTVSDDGLSTTARSDLDGNGVSEREETSTTLLGTDGSRTTTTATHSSDGSLLSAAQTIVSDDGLTTTVSRDADGDSVFDLTLTETTVLQADGGRTVTAETRDSAGALRSAVTTTSNDNGRDVTTQTDLNGDGAMDLMSVRQIADDGASVVTETAQAADGTLQSRSESTTGANGLTRTVRVDADGDGSFERSTTSTTVLGADGTRTTTVAEAGGDGTLWRQSVSTVSDDGRTTTTARDDDADGTDDLSTVTTLDIAADGVETVTTEARSADGALLRSGTTVTSADGRTVTSEIDNNGNGVLDQVMVTALGDDGVTTVSEAYYTTGGALEGTLQSSVSADGLTRTYEIDRNADGTAEHVMTDVTVLAQDGSIDRTIQHRTGSALHLGREEYQTSDDGLTRVSRLDVDGTTGFESVSEETTTYEVNGDVVRREITRDAGNVLMSEVVTTVSGNGLQTNVAADFDGDGTSDRSISLSRGASGGYTEVTTEAGAGGATLRQETRTMSADGWTSTTATDLNGDGATDRETTAVTDLSMNVNTTWRDLAADGSVLDEITGMVSANGMQRSVYLDVDGDGADDLMRTWTVTFDAAGNEITTYQETAGNGVLADREVTTTPANGLSSVRTIDLDGDGALDGTMVTTTTLNTDGSRTTLSETHYADGDLRSSDRMEVSRDGRLVTERHDYDGNGLADKTSELEIRSDGERILTETSYGRGGNEISTFVTTTSSDGLVTTINRNGVVETITRSVVGNGSYVWDNGNSAAQVTVSHEIDAFGIETWVYTGTAGTFTARLDAAGKERVLSEAARIYDTVLDRDMDRVETEELVRFVTEGQLDRASLTEELLGSAELSTRYGVLTDAGFVAQFYLNTFGRAPSPVELNGHLRALEAGTITRADLLAQLAESSEHLVVGNTHMATNNFDVIMNPAEFERSLDRAYVEALVKKLIDVAYDRDATLHELEYYSSLLLDGTDNADDVAGRMLALDGTIQGVSSASLKDLSGGALVDQAFLNAFGRQPTAVEQQIWTENLSAGRVSKNELVVALAQSTEKLEEGNAHQVNPLPPVTTLTGTAAAETLNGANGQDLIEGLGGDDVIEAGDGSDVLEGGSGNDTLRGGNSGIQLTNGSDTYIWSKGDGNDFIEDTSQSGAETDRLVLRDVAATEVSVSLASWSANLEINILPTGETLTDYKRLSSNNYYGLEEIEFSDGTVWSLDHIFAATQLSGTAADETLYANFGDFYVGMLAGMAGNDNLYGDRAADQLFGGAGSDNLNGWGGDDHLFGGLDDDVLYGGTGSLQSENGNDTYHWSKGDGNDVIYDLAESLLETDTLVLTDVNSSEVALSRPLGTKNLEISISSTGEKITVLNNFSNVGTLAIGIEAIQFSDGVNWDITDILAQTSHPSGTSGSDTLSGFEGEYDDIIFGLEGNDSLSGFGGDDELYGGSGNDQISGGEGDDTIDGGTGEDRLSGGGGNDTLTGGADNDDLNGFGGNDELRGDGGDDIARGGHGNDILFGGDGFDTLEGDEGNDHIDGGEDDDELFGGTGNDYLDGGSGFDSLYGGGGDDLLKGGGGIDILTGDDGSDHLYGGDGADELAGGSGDDRLFGENGADTIEGGYGNDYIVGGLGVDTLDGDEGSDTYYWSKGDGKDRIEDYSLSTSDVDTLILGDVSSTDVDLSWKNSGLNLRITILSTGEWITDDARSNFDLGPGVGLEAIEFSDGVTWGLNDILAAAAPQGTEGNDQIDGYDGTYGDVIYGYGGRDTIYGNGGNDTLYGGTGNDDLSGNAGDDLIFGEIGNDYIDGGTGDDLLTGGTGVDTFVFYTGSGADVISDFVIGEDVLSIQAATIDLTALPSTISAADSADGLILSYGSGSTVTLEGLTTADLIAPEVIQGTTGSDLIDVSYVDASGISVNDTGQIIYGDRGHDTIFAGTGDDIIHGGRQHDTIHAGDGDDTVYGDNGRDTVYLGAGNDLFVDNNQSGNNARDTVYGEAGNDVLQGGGGDETFSGGIGNDTLTGGADADTFVFTTGDGNDTITDFTLGVDVIRFEGTGLGFADLTITDSAGDAVVDYGSDQIELSGILASSLTSDNFTFA
ncbi:DUF4214 domain-containing protein [Roseobacter sp. S98]|uniref:DUF4214 domain-containing protein n=1 Tax=Roseobacter algicola (ex Choi et al. 2025) (nom. illeg.) TaxID=3092138 RepID=UPI003F514D81